MPIDNEGGNTGAKEDPELKKLLSEVVLKEALTKLVAAAAAARANLERSKFPDLPQTNQWTFTNAITSENAKRHS